MPTHDVVEAEAEVSPPRRLVRAATTTSMRRPRLRALRAAGVGGVAAAIAFAAWQAQHEVPVAASVTATLDSPQQVEAFEDVVEPEDDHRFSVGSPEELTDDGEEVLHVRFPSLSDWVHPVAGIEQRVPTKHSRRFGAEREGERPAECGKGHCGVDLFDGRGTPVVAVAFGVVTLIRHDPNRRSGRYVRVQHPEGAETSYMHLDAIAPGLRRGQEVEPGQLLGTLGRTGITQSAAHLHFSLAVPVGRGMRYVDPLPYLGEAVVIDSPVDAP